MISLFFVAFEASFDDAFPPLFQLLLFVEDPVDLDGIVELVITDSDGLGVGDICCGQIRCGQHSFDTNFNYYNYAFLICRT